MLSKDYPLNTICKVLNVSKSAYLYWLNIEINNQNNTIRFYHAIIKIYSESNGIYGAPKITNILKQQGTDCSVAKVSRAMKIIGIKSIVKKRFPKKISRITDEEKSLIVNLIKDLVIDHLNQVWTTDITYIQTINEGTFYLISYIDYYSKKVIAWGLFDRQRSDEVIFVLKQAVKKRKPNPGLIVHSDKGSQMRSKAYRKYLIDNNFAFSYTSLNHSCDENAAQESFHSLLKTECIYQHKVYTKEQAYRLIYDYIEGFYNPIRVHSSIGYLSPNNFEKNQMELKTPSDCCPKT